MQQKRPDPFPPGENDLPAQEEGRYTDSREWRIYDALLGGALDNEARLQALDDWHAWWSYARGRSVGIKTTWKF